MNDSKETLKNMDEKQEVSTYSNKVKTSDIWRANDGVLCVCLSQNLSGGKSHMLKNYMNWKNPLKYIADFSSI